MELSTSVNRTALVVEDDAFVLSALAEILSDEEYDVLTASNGFSALRQALDYRPAVILLDLMLPERSGAEVLADLRAEPATRDAAIVVVSGHVDILGSEQLAATDGVVAKPFDVAELLSTVQRAMQRATTRHSEVARISAAGHHDAPARTRRAASVRRARGRR